MKNLSLIIPSFHSESLTEICVKSFIKFCPSDVNLEIIVVENSNDRSYRDNIFGISPCIKWFNNISGLTGSDANASAIQIGLKKATHDLIFTAHCDVCVTSAKFYESIFSKYDSGNKVVGMLYDRHPNRISAVHILGLLTSRDLLEKVNLYPIYKNGTQVMDVGDDLTKYCRDNGVSYYSFRNTYNDESLVDIIDSKYKEFDIVRCLSDDNDVIYMHLARGVAKTNGTYKKKNKVGLEEWVSFCNNLLGD